ncbi:MucB/RseB C-terminal domain-containing protein [Thiohalobacter thiocyanaticus]|uniref:MucB/RseB n=1 Tax=Thiohalobacter thiocyanaticus TaxID=585455 RepID=A0A426QHG2_9GAMM|nr:MucB/RseB C-terminal domain-containing protein [Thiohalobacter thiocyanaticus]RRQ21198.1 MucB/RseB [Thiohalobacter thiocyanaticus]
MSRRPRVPSFPAASRIPRWLALLLTAALFSQPLAAGEAFDWLDRMSAAIHDLNYRGTFVYQHNGKLEAMYIVHRGGEDSRQRLFALSGAAREVVRDQEGVTCILSDSKAVMVDRSLPRGPFAALPRDLEQLNRYYRFSLGGTDRVLERHSRVVVVEPRDDYRYGYRFWLDREHALPLRSALVTAAGRPLEQMMFTQLEVLEQVDDAALRPELGGEHFTRFEGPGPDTEEEVPAAAGSDWEFTWLPAGFELRGHNWHGMPVSGQRVEHWVYGDGLATVSVYIETYDETSPPGLQGLSNMGAVNAMGRTLDGHHVTVVGEVPAETVERLAMGVRRND